VWCRCLAASCSTCRVWSIRWAYSQKVRRAALSAAQESRLRGNIINITSQLHCCRTIRPPSRYPPPPSFLVHVPHSSLFHRFLPSIHVSLPPHSISHSLPPSPPLHLTTLHQTPLPNTLRISCYVHRSGWHQRLVEVRTRSFRHGDLWVRDRT
jgi:hypothetical protein